MSQTAQQHNKKGIELCEASNYTEAVNEFSKALAIDSQHTEALYNRAKAYFRSKQFPKALEDFDTLIDRFPTQAFYYSERAVALHLSGDSELAMKDLDKAVELEPNKPFRYSSRAFIRDKMGDTKGAIADYEKTIELDPDDAIAYNNKGIAEEKLGHLEKSKKSFAEADKRDPAKVNSSKVAQTTSPKIKEEKIPEPQPQVEIKQAVKEKTQEPAPTQQEKVTLKGYFKTLKGLLTDKNERKEFTQFLKNINKKK